jgi:4-alpha-glucanotransferase
MNFPGIANGNWRWRLKDGALTQELVLRLRSITVTYGRLGSCEPPAPRCPEDDPTPQIARRAYELYERRDRQIGQAVEDWLRAQQKLKLQAKR